jgi:nitrogen fixation protein NifB
MSTNGLLLPQKAEEIVAAGVETLTVTVNDIDPTRLAQLNDYIVYEGRRYTGKEAAEILIAQQLEGIRRVTAAGVVVKVNTVLVPSVNGEYIGDIARTVAMAGASLYNIIPLIPNAKLSDFPAPTCTQIDAARQAAEQHITVFRHCQHCRADAIGVPGGKDYADRIYLNRVHQANTFSHG